jgi:C-terminal associated domain of TOPRIM
VVLQGLGTSTAKEAKEYFAKIDTHQIPFDWEDDERDADLIEMAFDKKRQKDRKTWLKGFKYVVLTAGLSLLVLMYLQLCRVAGERCVLLHDGIHCIYVYELCSMSIA